MNFPKQERRPSLILKYRFIYLHFCVRVYDTGIYGDQNENFGTKTGHHVTQNIQKLLRLNENLKGSGIVHCPLIFSFLTIGSGLHLCLAVTQKSSVETTSAYLNMAMD